MKLKINKACDLSSISVLPPRRSGGTCSGADGMGRSQASQIRSQSQQSLSQGVSLSQLSQSSFDETLINDQRFNSQENDNSLKNISRMAPIASSRDESQLQISRASSNALHRWSAPSFSDNRFQVNEALEHKFRLIESSMNRFGIILDSVQSDVMQVNRAVKEVSLEAGGIRQKIGLLENSVQQMLKLEDNIKNFIGGNLSAISDKLSNCSSSGQLNEIARAVTALQEEIGARLANLESEIRQMFSRKEVRESNIKSSDIKYLNDVQSPVCRNHIGMKQSTKNSMLLRKAAVAPLMKIEQGAPLIKGEGKTLPVKSKVTEQTLTADRREILHRNQGEILKIVIDSDEESDGDISCLILNKETGNQRNLEKEVQKETLRILKKARKRKRQQMNLIAVD